MTDEDKCVFGIYGAPADMNVVSIEKDGKFFDKVSWAEAQRINDQNGGGWSVVGQPYKLNEDPPRLKQMRVREQELSAAFASAARWADRQPSPTEAAYRGEAQSDSTSRGNYILRAFMPQWFQRLWKFQPWMPDQLYSEEAFFSHVASVGNTREQFWTLAAPFIKLGNECPPPTS